MSRKPSNLPDTSKWKPKTKASESLSMSLQLCCKNIEDLVRQAAIYERSTKIENFDPGVEIEGMIGERLGALLPSRYAVTRGIVSDRDGATAGDCDLVVFSNLWFPRLKLGASSLSQRPHLPIDGVYSIGEVKSRLDDRSLDSAMEKLVIASRLQRPRTSAYRVTENREGSSCAHGRTNPLYTFIIATEIGPRAEFDRLIERFFDINKELARDDVVRALCVLGAGTITWGYRDPVGDEIRPARFMLEDLYEPIIPIRFDAEAFGSSFYPLVVDLMRHLYHSVLAPEDVAVAFGANVPKVSVPNSPEVVLPPGPEIMGSLDHPCREG